MIRRVYLVDIFAEPDTLYPEGKRKVQRVRSLGAAMRLWTDMRDQRRHDLADYGHKSGAPATMVETWTCKVTNTKTGVVITYDLRLSTGNVVDSVVE